MLTKDELQRKAASTSLGLAVLTTVALAVLLVCLILPISFLLFRVRLASSEGFNLIKVDLTLVAGIAAVAGLAVSYRKQGIEERRHIAEQERAFTDRYTIASEQLGHD